MLNKMGPKAVDILKNINGIDTSLATRIKDNMFVFEDLLNLDSEYIMKIIQSVESADVVVAMKNTTQEQIEKVTGAMSQRVKDRFYEESEMLTKVKIKDIEAAQRRMLAVAQKMMDDGVIESREYVMAENVYSSARILKDDKKVEKFELSNFLKNKLTPKEESNEFLELKLEEDGNSNLEKTEVKPSVQSMNIVDNSAVLEKIEPIFTEFEKMIKKIEEVSQKVTTIEQDAIIKGKEFDTQVIKAIKDLKQCATFFEQAAFGFESKLLKTSISIAQKIINSQSSEKTLQKIAKQTINQAFIKTKKCNKSKNSFKSKRLLCFKTRVGIRAFY